MNPHKPRGKRDETNAFRFALMRLRGAMEWTQTDLAGTLSVSKRTVSTWENGYWLPPFKQRVHVVLALRNAPPEYVLAIADGLGVSVDPALAPLLRPFRDALLEPDEEPGREEVTAPPAAVPMRPQPSLEALRAVVDAIVRDAADTMNVPANDLRAALGRTLAACEDLGATMAGTREALAVRARAKPGSASDL